MPLLVPTFTVALTAQLTGMGYLGPMLPVFTLAVSTGIVTTSIGLTGQVTTPVLVGVSAGVGIIGISSSNIATTIVDTGKTLFGTDGGSELRNFADAIGSVTVSQFALATLASDTNGSATFSSFSGAIDSMRDAIVAAAPGFTGPQWENFAEAIATGVCTEIGAAGTGVLAGAAAPGAGSGTVIIS